MAPLLLAAAILFEVMGTLSLRLAVNGRREWYAVVVGGYLLAFLCLSAALTHGMGLGFAYRRLDRDRHRADGGHVEDPVRRAPSPPSWPAASPSSRTECCCWSSDRSTEVPGPLGRDLSAR